jgi:hypothetical protein
MLMAKKNSILLSVDELGLTDDNKNGKMGKFFTEATYDEGNDHEFKMNRANAKGG